MLTDVRQRPAGAEAESPGDVTLAAAGDVSAFERLYRLHVARVHSLVRRMAGAQLADELTQDVFVRVWRKLASFRGESAFGTWLHRLAVNVVIERSRKDGLTRSREVEDSAGAYAVARASSPVVRLGIEAALEDLPDGARRVFVLYDIEGYTHQEIGTLLGITVGTSKTQLHRARVLLRQRLSHRSDERGS